MTARCPGESDADLARRLDAARREGAEQTKTAVEAVLREMPREVSTDPLVRAVAANLRDALDAPPRGETGEEATR